LTAVASIRRHGAKDRGANLRITQRRRRVGGELIGGIP